MSRRMVKTKKKSLMTTGGIILFIVVLVFIFGQSLMPVSISSDESSRVLNKIVQPMLDKIAPGTTLSLAMMRKIAHVMEYALLGLILTFALRPGKKWMTLNIGLIVGLCDETLQYLTDRSPEIRDVWIDFLGILIGFGLAMLCSGIASLFRRR